MQRPSLVSTFTGAARKPHVWWQGGSGRQAPATHQAGVANRWHTPSMYSAKLSGCRAPPGAPGLAAIVVLSGVCALPSTAGGAACVSTACPTTGAQHMA